MSVDEDKRILLASEDAPTLVSLQAMQERLDTILEAPEWYRGSSWYRHFPADDVMKALQNQGCISMKFSALLLLRTTVVESESDPSSGRP